MNWLEQLMWEGAARVLQEITNEEKLLRKAKSSIVPPLPVFKWLFNFNQNSPFAHNGNFLPGFVFVRKWWVHKLSLLFLSFRGRKQHIYLSSYQSSLPLCQKRHKHRARMSRRKDELMAMERSAALHLSAGRWRKRPSWEGVNISPEEVAGKRAACQVSGDPGSQAAS